MYPGDAIATPQATQSTAGHGDPCPKVLPHGSSSAKRGDPELQLHAQFIQVCRYQEIDTGAPSDQRQLAGQRVLHGVVMGGLSPV